MAELRRDLMTTADLRRSSETPEGYLLVEGVFSRVGVFPYRRADGRTEYELRPPDEVLALDSLESAARKPLTLGHPSSLVDPASVGSVGVGVAGERIVSEVLDGYATITFVVQRADAIAAVRKGTRELSPGYTVVPDRTSGWWDPETRRVVALDGVDEATRQRLQRFDVVQRQIRYNHHALVDQGRQGIGLRADEAEQVPSRTETRRAAMPRVRIDGVEYELEDGAARAVAGVVQRLEEADRQLATEKARADAEAKRADAEKVRADAAALTPAQLLAEFNARAEVLPLARHLKLDKPDEIPTGELRRQVVDAFLGEQRLAVDAPQAAVDAAYAVARKALGDATRRTDQLAQVFVPTAPDPSRRADETALDAARRGYFARLTGQAKEAQR